MNDNLLYMGIAAAVAYYFMNQQSASPNQQVPSGNVNTNPTGTPRVTDLTVTPQGLSFIYEGAVTKIRISSDEFGEHEFDIDEIVEGVLTHQWTTGSWVCVKAVGANGVNSNDPDYQCRPIV